MPSLEQQFERLLRELAQRSVAECDYRPTYFLQMLDELGGVAAAKALLAKSMPSEGFTRLFEMGRLDLVVESAVIDPRWSALFTEDEIRKAKRWLGR